ncbi:MAG: hypothetical protein WAK91_03660, partial [Candidatus Acidiferrales bacterium]
NATCPDRLTPSAPISSHAVPVISSIPARKSWPQFVQENLITGESENNCIEEIGRRRRRSQKL